MKATLSQPPNVVGWRITPAISSPRCNAQIMPGEVASCDDCERFLTVASRAKLMARVHGSRITSGNVSVPNFESCPMRQPRASDWRSELNPSASLGASPQTLIAASQQASMH